MSINTWENIDPDMSFSWVLTKSMKNTRENLTSEQLKKTCLSMGTGSALNGKKNSNNLTKSFRTTPKILLKSLKNLSWTLSFGTPEPLPQFCYQNDTKRSPTGPQMDLPRAPKGSQISSNGPQSGPKGRQVPEKPLLESLLNATSKFHQKSCRSWHPPTLENHWKH